MADPPGEVVAPSTHTTVEQQAETVAAQVPLTSSLYACQVFVHEKASARDAYLCLARSWRLYTQPWAPRSACRRR